MHAVRALPNHRESRVPALKFAERWYKNPNFWSADGAIDQLVLECVKDYTQSPLCHQGVTSAMDWLNFQSPPGLQGDDFLPHGLKGPEQGSAHLVIDSEPALTVSQRRSPDPSPYRPCPLSACGQSI